VFAIALPKGVLHQSSPTPFVATHGFDADKGQIPVGFGRPIIFCPLEDGPHFSLLLRSNALCNDRLKLLIVATNAWRIPERDAEAVTGTQRCSSSKRACSKSLEQSRHVRQILEQIGIHPTRYRIIAKRHNKRVDGTVDFGIPGNAHYVVSLMHLYQWRHLFSLFSIG
jgi:hypothetical protein